MGVAESSRQSSASATVSTSSPRNAGSPPGPRTLGDTYATRRSTSPAARSVPCNVAPPSNRAVSTPYRPSSSSVATRSTPPGAAGTVSTFAPDARQASTVSDGTASVVQVRRQRPPRARGARPDLDVEPGRPESREPAPCDLRVRVLERHHDAPDAGCDQRVGARRGATFVRAGLEGDIGGAVAGPLP